MKRIILNQIKAVIDCKDAKEMMEYIIEVSITGAGACMVLALCFNSLVLLYVGAFLFVWCLGALTIIDK